MIFVVLVLWEIVGELVQSLTITHLIQQNTNRYKYHNKSNTPKDSLVHTIAFCNSH